MHKGRERESSKPGTKQFFNQLPSYYCRQKKLYLDFNKNLIFHYSNLEKTDMTLVARMRQENIKQHAKW